MGRHSATAVASETRGRPARWFTKFRAVLAGALVLGVGATVTVAAWNDAEVATGTFMASEFGIVGSTDGTTFSEHPAAESAATLTFTTPFDAMSPGTTVYARFVVKTTDTSSVSGSVSLTAAPGNASGFGQWLRYGVRTIPEGDACTGSTFNASTTDVVKSDSALTANGTRTTPVAEAGGDTANYCFAITLPVGTTNDAQGTTVDAQWTFTATSDA